MLLSGNIGKGVVTGNTRSWRSVARSRDGRVADAMMHRPTRIGTTSRAVRLSYYTHPG